MSKLPSNFVGEWFGRRIYPKVYLKPADLVDIEKHSCPFLTEALGQHRTCVKSKNSLGVCTITTRRPAELDWIVCPNRALDLDGFVPVVRRIFGLPPNTNILVKPASALNEPASVDAVRKATERTFLYFTTKLGGELSIPKSKKSPELSFDMTIVECLPDAKRLHVGRFGFYEIQTMDFHGSYKHAVSALLSGLNLHGKSFPDTLQANIEWAGRGVEGPNISNVFKRTFYQMMLKFELAGYKDCAGVALGLPKAVWQSWMHHLALPTIVPLGDHLAFEGSNTETNAWVLTLSPDEERKQSIQPLRIDSTIRVNPNDLLKRAFGDVSQHISTDVMPLFRQRVISRLASFAGERIAVS